MRNNVCLMPRVAWVGLAFGVCGLVLSACVSSGIGPIAADTLPDATDHIRSADLQPRWPTVTPTSTTGTSQGGAPAFVHFGGDPSLNAPLTTPSGDTEGFTLNFDSAPVTTVAKAVLGDILGVGYTIDPRAQGTISLSSGRPVAKTDVLFVLESALRMSNLILIRDANAYRIVPASDGLGSGSLDSAGNGNGPEPGYGVTAIPLKHVSAQTIAKLLEGFATKPGMIRSSPSGGMLLVVGTGAERRTAAETALSFDVDWMRGQSVGIFPVHSSAPETLIAELEKLMDAGEGGMGHDLVKFEAISRSNAILVVAKKPDLLQRAAAWIGRLDRSDTAAQGVKVYRVRYGDARQIAKLLNEMFIGSGQGLIDSPANQLAPATGATTLTAVDKLTGGARLQVPGANISGPGTADLSAPGLGFASSGSHSGASGGEQPLLQGVRITPDVVNNALLIYASQENYRIIERTLAQLDRQPLQVAIELTIAEVTLNDQLNYGVQFFLANKLGSVGNTIGAPPLNGIDSAGLNLVLGNSISPRVILNALHSYTDVKVLSNPSLVVVDNQPATLEVGDQVPITTGTATVLSGNNAVVNTVDYRNTGIILHVQPRINSNGNVLLDIEQEISSVPNTGTATLTPTISQRKVKSSISVVNGQTVLLAGLISETQSRGRTGIPGLDLIPLIGDALSTENNKGTSRTELIIFIRPSIIRDSVDASVVAEELRSKLRGSKIGSVEPPGAVVPRAPHLTQ